MKYLLSLLIVFTGCVSTHHKHPHDHGLSAYKGHFKRMDENVNRLVASLQSLEIEIVTNRKGLDSLTGRVAKESETNKKRLALIESDILELERLVGAYGQEFEKDILKLKNDTKRIKFDVDNWFRNDIKIMRSDIKELLRLTQEIIKRLFELEKDQKFIELGKD